MSALLDGQIALVTGVANRWSIATGIARELHRHGAAIVLTYQGERVQAEVEKLAAELGGRAYPCDVASDDSLAALAQSVQADCGRLDVLVHSIAFVNKEDLAGKVYTTTRAGFAVAADVSAYSLIALTNALIGVLADGASIMAMTYFGSTAIVPNYNVAGIVKAALESIVRYLAFDLGDRGIRVNAISAGPVRTVSAASIPGFSSILKWNEEHSFLRRNVSLEDIAGAAVYLLSDAASGVTGEILHVDSGHHAQGMRFMPGM